MKTIIFFSKIMLCTALFTFAATSCDKDDDCPAPSTKNTELVKAQLGFFLSGDIPSFLAGCDATCTYDLVGNQILDPGKVYNGEAGFMAFLGDLSAKGQPTNFTPLEFFESGDVVTVTAILEFTDFATTQTCSVNVVQIWKFNGGKVILLKEDHDNRVCE